jgi:hypothetical protein
VITTHKYTLQLDALEPNSALVLDMPDGASVLSVQEQRGSLVMWALVDTDKPMEKRRFAIYGTGHAVPIYIGVYHGTVQLAQGHLVVHVWEVPGRALDDVDA